MLHPSRPASPPSLPTRRSCCCATAFTVAPIVFGLDKFTNLLTDWPVYLAPWIDDLVPGHGPAGDVRRRRGRDPGRGRGRRGPRFGGWLVAAWLGGIIVNLLTIPGFYDIALRDFGLLAGAVALARLAAAARARPPRRRGCALVSAAVPRRIDGTGRRGCASSGTAPPSTVPAAERAVADLLRALGRDPADAAPGRDAAAGGRRLRRAAHRRAVRADHLPQRRGLQRARPGHRTSRSSRSASTTCCRSPGSPTSATCRATGSSGCPSSPACSTCSPATSRCRSG